MGSRSDDRAMDCTLRSTDWTALGARIRHAAELAAGLHEMEEGQVLRVRLREPEGGLQVEGSENEHGDTESTEEYR